MVIKNIFYEVKGMRWLINYIRSCFCEHDWELIHNGFVNGGEYYDSYYCKVYRCKKCGYSKKYKSH